MRPELQKAVDARVEKFRRELTEYAEGLDRHIGSEEVLYNWRENSYSTYIYSVEHAISSIETFGED